MSDYHGFDLEQWLDHIQNQHWRSIELTLDRVSEVWQRLQGDKAPFVITIAGTNGKGSCVAMLESILRHSGQRTGSYTSPHLVRYNERVCVDGQPVSDEVICAAFRQIESARAEIPLTYFEFGTLSALLIFMQHGVDAWVLETGMGGRLDAVNIIDNDVALITSIGLDHEQWLGSDREEIGREKSGVFKSGALAVCADPAPPASVAETALKKNTTLLQLGADFQLTESDGSEDYRWLSRHPLVAGDWQQVGGLKPPFSGQHQAQNLSGVMAVIALTRHMTGIQLDHVYAGLSATRIAARCEIIADSPKTILDVAHNADSADELGKFLTAHPVSGRTYAVLGVLKDKELTPILQNVAGSIDQWFLATLEGERGQTADQLGQRLQDVLPAVKYKGFSHPAAAYVAAREEANAEDRIVIFGSFYTVGDIIAFLEQESNLS